MSKKKLFHPIKVGRYEILNRVVMAPLTRYRSPNHIPSDLTVQYYEQRSREPGSLIISEATFITKHAGGYINAPGIWSSTQISTWHEISDVIHANGSFLFIQLWALGKTANKEYLESIGEELVAPSSVPTIVPNSKLIQETANIQKWNKEHPEEQKPLPSQPKPVTPRPLTNEEIERYIFDYGVAAENSIKAGADGVEIHGANGYLPEQFLYEGSNLRSDKWGGSIENRARFLLEVVDNVVGKIGADRTGLRLSPWRSFPTENEGNPVEQWSYVIRKIKERHPDLAYIHFVEPNGSTASIVNFPFNKNATNKIFEELWGGTTIKAGGYTIESAIKETEEHENVLIGIGRHFISNPDLILKWKNNKELTHYDRSTFYTEGSKGYIDYPFDESIIVK